MTINLPAMKALADRLAGDIMNQIERDGGANRNNLAETLLAGLILEEALPPEIEKNAKPGEFLQSRPDGRTRTPPGEFHLVTHALDAAKGAKRNMEADRVGEGVVWNIGTVHVFCECPVCQAKRNHSPDAEYQTGRFSETRVDNAKDLSGGFEITTLNRGALQIWHRSDIKRIWAMEELDALFTALHDLGKDGERFCIPLTNLELVLLRSGELITGLEAAQRGVK